MLAKLADLELLWPVFAFEGEVQFADGFDFRRSLGERRKLVWYAFIEVFNLIAVVFFDGYLFPFSLLFLLID